MGLALKCRLAIPEPSFLQPSPSWVLIVWVTTHLLWSPQGQVSSSLGRQCCSESPETILSHRLQPPLSFLPLTFPRLFPSVGSCESRIFYTAVLTHESRCSSNSIDLLHQWVSRCILVLKAMSASHQDLIKCIFFICTICSLWDSCGLCRSAGVWSIYLGVAGPLAHIHLFLVLLLRVKSHHLSPDSSFPGIDVRKKNF